MILLLFPFVRPLGKSRASDTLCLLGSFWVSEQFGSLLANVLRCLLVLCHDILPYLRINQRNLHGRNAGFPTPPAQTLTCGFPESGSSVVLASAQGDNIKHNNIRQASLGAKTVEFRRCTVLAGYASLQNYAIWLLNLEKIGPASALALQPFGSIISLYSFQNIKRISVMFLMLFKQLHFFFYFLNNGLHDTVF